MYRTGVEEYDKKKIQNLFLKLLKFFYPFFCFIITFLPGIKRMLNNGSYSAAFPLHDVSNTELREGRIKRV